MKNSNHNLELLFRPQHMGLDTKLILCASIFNNPNDYMSQTETSPFPISYVHHDINRNKQEK